MTIINVDPQSDLESGVAVIRLEYDYGSTQLLALQRLETTIRSVLDTTPKTVLLDLRDTHSVGAAFLSVLLRCQARAARANCCIALCMLNALSAEVLSAAHLGETLPTFCSQQSAIKTLARSKKSLAASHPHIDDEKFSCEFG